MMTGSELDVYLGNEKIASLSLINDELVWVYVPAWLRTGYSISPGLPLSDNKLSHQNTRNFLRNLLPEGEIFETLIQRLQLSRYNIFGLMRALGLDLSGALVLVPANNPLPTKPLFKPITLDELAQRLNTHHLTELLIWNDKPRLSVAGVQSKLNVLRRPDGQLGFAEGALCSTHLLKFEKQQFSHLVLNEYVTMQLAACCDLIVANCQLLKFDNHQSLLIERFDRKFISLEQVKRRHVIDGCQALNLPPEYKYERYLGSNRDVAHIRDGVSLPKLFSLAEQCINVAETKLRILDWVLFNILIFNNDAHGKNISFFMGKNGLSLAPFYDLVNIKMYPDFSQEMAMALGDEFDSNTVHAYQLATFADGCALPRRLVAKRLNLMIKKLLSSWDKVLEGLSLSADEQQFISLYVDNVTQHCHQLLQQIDEIVSTDL